MNFRDRQGERWFSLVIPFFKVVRTARTEHAWVSPPQKPSTTTKVSQFGLRL